MRNLGWVLSGLALLGPFGADRLRADPAEYAVTPGVGPWMVLVTYYSGPEAPQLAEGLARELREKYGLASYLFNRGAEERRKQQEEIRAYRERLKQIAPEGKVRITRIEEQFAVLVGAWPDMETARKALDAIRRLKPPSEKYMAVLTKANTETGPGETAPLPERSFVNPFLNSFVVRNPTVPREADASAKQADPSLKKLNANESYSLLRCHKPWTLVVKTYRGGVMVQSTTGADDSFLSKFGWGKKDIKLLDAGGQQAHSVAEALRRLGYESYVLHTRHNSIVTVGTYDRSDDPQLLQNQRMLANLQMRAGDVVVEQLFAQPLPMEVPKP